MSILGNLSDLAHEIRCATGTVLAILGSRLEADARARVECGLQWLTGFEEQRDSLEPCMCYGDCEGKRNRRCVMTDEESTDDEGEQKCDCLACELGYPEGCTADAYFGELPLSSAAVSAAADPSPNNPRMGDRPGSDSVILPTVEPGPQTSHPPSYQEAVSEAHPRNHVWLWEYDASGRSCKLCGYVDRSFPAPVVVAGESPREEEEQPSLGAAVTHEDLAAHLIGAAIQANTGHVDVLVEAFASSLLADFNITRREAAGE